MRQVLADGHRFELLYDSEADRTTLRHKPTSTGVHVDGEAGLELQADILETERHIDLVMADIWFSEGYGARAVHDEGCTDEILPRTA